MAIQTQRILGSSRLGHVFYLLRGFQRIHFQKEHNFYSCIPAIYDTGEIPSDLSKSIFIALPKKPGATECESHRTISLMSHITKILLKILMARMRNKITPEIAEEQCGFVKDKGTRNAIYMLRTLTERAMEIQRDLYLCFIDYTKAFDKLRHEEIMSILDSLNIDGKDLRIVRNIIILGTNGGYENRK